MNKTRSRVTLSKSQLAEDAGSSLLALLGEITSDGEITVAEVERLQTWLDDRGTEHLPAIVFLTDVVTEILSDGRISRDERLDLVLAIERVLPKGERLLAQERRQAVERHDAGFERSPATAYPSGAIPFPATEPQLRYIAGLGGSAPEGCTRDQASKIIEDLLSSAASVSCRQLMVLRFWGHEHLAQNGRRAVSDWLDEWYAENSDRHAAWQLWKEENHDCGRQSDPEIVSVGIGSVYLERVRAPQKRVRAGTGCLVLVATLAAMSAVAIASFR